MRTSYSFARLNAPRPDSSKWSKRETALSDSAKPTPHALAPIRQPANMLMPIKLIVVAWRRCGAISTMDRCTGGATLGACVLLTLRVGCIGLSGHDPHPSRVSLEADQLDRMATRHVERVVVVGANARTYGSADGPSDASNQETTRRCA